jgi:hypothetical protein
MSFSRLSTGTKLASKTQKKFKKVSVLDLVPVLRVQKQLKKTFQKTVKMYLVPATNLKNKKKILRLVAGTKYGVFRYYYQTKRSFHITPRKFIKLSF